MTRLLLDSTFLIDHLRGNVGAVERLRRAFEWGDIPFTSEVVVCEVQTGLRASDEPALMALLSPIELIQPPVEAALTAGRWRAQARLRGRTLSLADALIAAAADAVGATVLTRNARDFSLTPVPQESY